MSKGVQMAIATLSVFAAVGWMVASSEGSFRFFEDIAQLSERDLQRESGLRVRGFVVDGSISRSVEEQQIRFAIRDANPEEAARSGSAPQDRAVSTQSRQLQVRYDGIDVPDLFADGAEVVIEGGFTDGVFVASRITAKCPSKYEVAPALPEQNA